MRTQQQLDVFFIDDMGRSKWKRLDAGIHIEEMEEVVGPVLRLVIEELPTHAYSYKHLVEEALPKQGVLQI